MDNSQFLTNPIFYLILAWTLPWKGVALWKAAKNSHRVWFIAIFLLNTLALLEIIYLFYFSKPSQSSDQS